jgi:deazaflavin-dependent oxidoreductase (nitroreductase family)
MIEIIERALRTDRLIDISTTGRKTGKTHRIEISFHTFEDEIYISGSPGKRDWYANLIAQPEFVFHFKQSIEADIPAKATPILDEESRKRILPRIVQKWGRLDELRSFVENSPLVRVQLLLEEMDLD